MKNLKVKNEYRKFFNKLKKNNPKAYHEFVDERNRFITQSYMEIPVPVEKIERMIKTKSKNSWAITNKVRLTEKQSVIFELYYVNRMSVEGICKEMGLCQSAVYRIIARISKKLLNEE